MKNELREGEDFYYNDQGFIVLTAAYHLERGNCCGNGCIHCPYGYINVAEPPYHAPADPIEDPGA